MNWLSNLPLWQIILLAALAVGLAILAVWLLRRKFDFAGITLGAPFVSAKFDVKKDDAEDEPPAGIAQDMTATNDGEIDDAAQDAEGENIRQNMKADGGKIKGARQNARSND